MGFGPSPLDLLLHLRRYRVSLVSVHYLNRIWVGVQIVNTCTYYLGGKARFGSELYIYHTMGLAFVLEYIVIKFLNVIGSSCQRSRSSILPPN